MEKEKKLGNVQEEERGKNTEGIEEESIRNKALLRNKTLPGLDVKEGKFRVAGIVSANPIFVRKGPNTNITQSTGYAVEEIATGRVIYMTKMEGVALAARYGMQNAYIIQHSRNKKDSEGGVIKVNESIYLQPYPARAESFTQDGRIVNVFELDEDNKLKYPLNLLITEEQCTKDFWMLVQKLYEQRKNKRRRGRKRERNLEEKRRKRILEIEAEINKTSIENPFE